MMNHFVSGLPMGIGRRCKEGAAAVMPLGVVCPHSPVTGVAAAARCTLAAQRPQQKIVANARGTNGHRSGSAARWHAVYTWLLAVHSYRIRHRYGHTLSASEIPNYRP